MPGGSSLCYEWNGKEGLRILSRWTCMGCCSITSFYGKHVKTCPFQGVYSLPRLLVTKSCPDQNLSLPKLVLTKTVLNYPPNSFNPTIIPTDLPCPLSSAHPHLPSTPPSPPSSSLSPLSPHPPYPSPHFQRTASANQISYSVSRYQNEHLGSKQLAARASRWRKALWNLQSAWWSL